MSETSDPAITVPARPSTPHGGEVITFYSYKGGTGRSMMLANVAWLLAASGRRVLLVDWDLEAPGLHRYFKPFLGDDPELRQQEGVIEWITDYWDARLEDPAGKVTEQLRSCADPRHYVRKLETGSLLSGGIDLLCAGRQDKNYAKAVADFDWTRLFDKLDGEQFIEAAKSVLVGPGGYDYVLVDSRTGVSDTSGFCTVLLADTLVVSFTYNNQSVIGASHIARDIKQQAEQRRRDAVAQGRARRFRVFAVPSRVDDLDPERLDRRQQHAWAAFKDLLTDVAPDQQASYWLSVQVRNQGLFAYEEVLAACMNRPNDPQSVLGAVTQLTRILTDDAFTEPPLLSDHQRKDLRDQFGTLAETPTCLQSQTAWQFFELRMPESGAREALLHACFPLLVQLFAVSTTDGGTPMRGDVVRMMVLEGELTVDERRMAEMLTSLGVTQRRITDDRQRGLIIADESILPAWPALGQRLGENLDFIGARDRLRQARRTWDASGRSVAALRALQGEFAQLDLKDEQRAWMGRPNLQFLQAVLELRAIDAAEAAGKKRLGIVEKESQARVAQLQKRLVTLEDQRERREMELTTSAGLLALATQRAERNSVRLRVSLMAAGLIVLGLLVGVGVAGQALISNRAQLLERVASTEQDLQAARREAVAANARVSEAERARAFDAAMRYYGEGTRLMVKAGRPGSADRERNLESAIAAFNQSIQANPSLGEAYRGRALARGNQVQRDVPRELQDWAAYYDRVPSLNGRSQLILRMLSEDSVDESLLGGQLGRLLDDAKQGPSPDASPQRVASSLEVRLNSFPANLQVSARRVIDSLRAVRIAPAPAGSSASSAAGVKTDTSKPARGVGGDKAAARAQTSAPAGADQTGNAWTRSFSRSGASAPAQAFTKP